METKEYKTIDRSGWPSGEWDSEPDKVQWPDPATGLPCLAVRHSHSGHWCGYVGVAEGHLLYGADYNDVRFDDEWPDVHGGLTFADKCRPGAEETGICHVPGEGEPDHVWWFGFDCAHSGDYGPLDAMYARDRGYPFSIGHDERYRPLAYVKAQCAKLAKQLATAA